jgi:hypothetical protein
MGCRHQQNYNFGLRTSTKHIYNIKLDVHGLQTSKKGNNKEFSLEIFYIETTVAKQLNLS